jgi:hypothetical protein
MFKLRVQCNTTLDGDSLGNVFVISSRWRDVRYLLSKRAVSIDNLHPCLLTLERLFPPKALERLLWMTCNCSRSSTKIFSCPKIPPKVETHVDPSHPFKEMNHSKSNPYGGPRGDKGAIVSLSSCWLLSEVIVQQQRNYLSVKLPEPANK